VSLHRQIFGEVSARFEIVYPTPSFSIVTVTFCLQLGGGGGGGGGGDPPPHVHNATAAMKLTPANAA
jgi:hypothetical protein